MGKRGRKRERKRGREQSKNACHEIA